MNSTGNRPILNENELHEAEVTTITKKYAFPLEVTIYGDIIIHEFWPIDLAFNDLEPRYLQESFDTIDQKFFDDYITIKCDNTLNSSLIVFELEMCPECSRYFNNILGNISNYTKSSHSPAIGIVEVPIGSVLIDTNIPGAGIVINGDVKLLNIIHGFETKNDYDFFKRFGFCGYDQDNVNKLPQVINLRSE